MAKAATAAEVERLLHVSVLGAAAGSRYGRSKTEAEAAVRTAFPDTTILRPSLMFGPDDDFFDRYAALARIAPMLPLINGGHTRFQPVPAALMIVKAWFLEFWPTPLLTRDQVRQLARDSVVNDSAEVGRLSDLGITPTALEAIVPAYLACYRRGGGLAPSRNA